jgi:hypothetical protein
MNITNVDPARAVSRNISTTLLVLIFVTKIQGNTISRNIFIFEL